MWQLIAYIAFIVVAVMFGAHWYQAAAYPWFVIFIYGLFFVGFKPQAHDIANLIFWGIALIAAFPCAAGFGKSSHQSDHYLSPSDY